MVTSQDFVHRLRDYNLNYLRDFNIHSGRERVKEMYWLFNNDQMIKLKQVPLKKQRTVKIFYIPQKLINNS